MASTSATHLLDTQVGGHPGIIESEDGSTIGKPALPLEHKFYDAIYGDNTKLQHLQDFKLLAPFIPKLMGTLRLVGRVDESQGDGELRVVPIEGEVDEPKETLWLENATYPFLKPNQMDIKLGTMLYDAHGPVTEEKRIRMTEQAKKTTSKDTGIRVTGFQVFKNTSNEVAVDFTKARGRSLKVSEIPDAFALFFPVGSEGPTQSRPPSTQMEPPPDCGLPLSTLLPILRGIHAEIAKIRDVYSTIEMRMVGGSFLIVYEADWERAAEGIERMKEKTGQHGGIDEEEDDENDDADDDDENSKRTIPFTVKLIDFAHTHMTPGEGPDEGVVLGMNKVLEFIGARIDDLEKGQSAPS